MFSTHAKTTSVNRNGRRTDSSSTAQETSRDVPDGSATATTPSGALRIDSARLRASANLTNPACSRRCNRRSRRRSLRRTAGRLRPSGDRILNSVTNIYSSSERHCYSASAHQARLGGTRYSEALIVTGWQLEKGIDLGVGDPGRPRPAQAMGEGRRFGSGPSRSPSRAGR